jgi:exopolysaccharide biosynthesis WecB/TagA/CpsF family protein
VTGMCGDPARDLSEDGAIDDAQCARFELLGIPLTLVTRAPALAMLERFMSATGATRWVCFLNFHSFNGAIADRGCRAAFAGASAVFPDGVALRVGARVRRLRIPENLPGTDLVPDMLRASPGGKCFLIGDTAEQIERAAHELERRFPAWSVVGFSPGFFAAEADEREAVERVNAARPDLLLIGMGSPRQERFIARHASELHVPLCMCVGGLFGYWSGKLSRAPRSVRKMCLEWLWILVQQPGKLRRYTIGAAKFFSTVFKGLESSSDGEPVAQCERR